MRGRVLLAPHFSLAAERPPALIAQNIECRRQRTRCAHSAFPAEKDPALDERKRQDCPHSMPALDGRAAYEKSAPEGARIILEAKPGFEPGVRALQARALPLGHFAV